MPPPKRNKGNLSSKASIKKAPPPNHAPTASDILSEELITARDLTTEQTVSDSTVLCG
jgi:hypothetical protein